MRSLLLLVLVSSASQALKCYSHKSIFPSAEQARTVDCSSEHCLIKPGTVTLFNCDTQNECTQLPETSPTICCKTDLCNRMGNADTAASTSTAASSSPIMSSSSTVVTTMAANTTTTPLAMQPTSTHLTTTTHKGAVAFSASILSIFVATLY